MEGNPDVMNKLNTNSDPHELRLTRKVLVHAFGHRFSSKSIHVGEVVAVPGAGGTRYPEIAAFAPDGESFTDTGGTVHRIDDLLE